MNKIKSLKQFKERVNGAFETMKTRDEAKIKSEGLDDEALAKLCLVRVSTMNMKLKAKSAA